MKRRKIYKCEFLLSTLSSSIINTRRSIPNPLFPLIDSDNSSFTWIINLKEKSFDEISYNFSKKTKDILNKQKDQLRFIELKKKDVSKILENFYNFHTATAKEKKLTRIVMNILNIYFSIFQKKIRRYFML